jgi:tetratricopeptide (TPR) repeat protein
VQEREQVQVEHRYLSRYHFTHLLFQQYLYNSLGIGERRLLHREIGAALEELYQGREEEIATIAPQLVRHYAGDAERERHYARLAGERAAAQFANAEAMYYLNLALDLTPEEEAEERYTILLNREKVLHLRGDREAQQRDLAALGGLVEDLDDGDLQAASRRVEVALRQARYAEAVGDYPAAIAAAQAVIDPAQISQDMNSEAAGHLQWGQALRRQGEYKAARLQFEQALNLARMAGARQAASRTLSQTVEADSLHNLGLVCWLQGDYAGAGAYPQQALRLYRELGNRRSESVALNTLGIVASEQGNYAEAERWFNETLHITGEIGDHRGEARALGNLGLVYAEYGNYAEAMVYFERSLDIRTAIDDREGMCGQLSNLSLLFHHQGDGEAAWEYGQRALGVAQEIGSRRWQGYALANLGRVLEGIGRLAEATDAYRQSLTLRRELYQHQLTMDSLAGLARVCLSRGDLNQAQVHVEEILSYLEGDNLEGIEEPFSVYLTCYRVLRASQDARAEIVLNTAHRLLQERAARISDEDLRRLFLENVAVHREIVRELAECFDTSDQ